MSLLLLLPPTHTSQMLAGYHRHPFQSRSLHRFTLSVKTEDHFTLSERVCICQFAGALIYVYNVQVEL